MSLLRLLNRALFKLSFAVAMTIVTIMVMALSLSAITRFISGTGYDWLIELPPVLVCWLVFPLLGPLFKQGSHIQVDFLSVQKTTLFFKDIHQRRRSACCHDIFQSRSRGNATLFSIGTTDGVGNRFANLVDVSVVSGGICNYGLVCP